MKEVNVLLTADTHYDPLLFEEYEVPQSLKNMMKDRGDFGASFEIARTQPAYFDESDEEAIRKYILNAGLAIIQQMRIQDPKIEVFNVDGNVITKPLTEEDWKKYEEYMDKLEKAVEEGDYDNEVFHDDSCPTKGKTCCPYEVVTENLPNKIFIYCYLNYEEENNVVPYDKGCYMKQVAVECNLSQFEKGIQEYNSMNNINIEDASKLLLSLAVDLISDK